MSGGVYLSNSSRSKVLSPVGRELLNIGISRKALATSLPKIGRDDVRTLVESGDFYYEDGQIKNIAIVRGKRGDSNDAELLMQLIAKELFLSGRSVSVFPVSDFLFSYSHEDTIRVDLDSDWMFFEDFYKTHSNDSGALLSLENVAIVESQIRYYYYRLNRGFCFYIGGELSDINKWWSDDFCQFVRKTSIEIKVK